MTAVERAVRPSALGRGYDAAAVAVPVVVLGIVAATSGAASVPLTAGSLAVFVIGWFAFGRRTLDGRRGWLAFCLLLVAVCAAGALGSPAFAVFQVIAFPLAWSVPTGLRVALAVNVAVTLAVGFGYALGTSVLEAVAVQAISLAFSLAMGSWISSIERRSEGRQVLIDRLTAAQEQVAALSRDAGVLAERERLARELHDTLTQSLTGIVMMAARAGARHPDDAALGVLEDAARQAMAEARVLVAETAGVPLEGGLVVALETLAARLGREAGLEVEVDVHIEVPRGLEVVLLRCAQEGLSNVRKHAGARRVHVQVIGTDGDAVLTVADDGRGPGDGAGFGLGGMRDRAALVGGSAELAAATRGGSVLTVRVPLRTEVPA